jgi:MATE family multidrug resistance protein
MVIALLGLAFNVLVNWLLIFGHFGLPRLGGVGCAVSTGLCMWLMLGAMLLWIRLRRPTAPPIRSATGNGRTGPRSAPCLRLGLPIGVTYFAEVSAFGAVSLLVARYGVVEVSAHQIALNFSSLTFMVPLSFGIALITRVGQAMGEGDAVRARFVAWVGVGMSLAFGVLSALLMVLLRQQIAAAYTSDLAVQALCAYLLLFAALFQLSDATRGGLQRDPRLQGDARADADPATGVLGFLRCRWAAGSDWATTWRRPASGSA